MTLYAIYVNTQNIDNAWELNNLYLESKETAWKTIILNSLW